MDNKEKEEFVHTELESLARRINTSVLMMAFVKDKDREGVRILFSDGSRQVIDVTDKGLKGITKRVLKAI